MISRRFVFLAALLLLPGGISISHAQDNSATAPQSDSLGDAARKARAQKKDSAKPAKVFTNDDVGGLKGTISVVGGGSSGPQAGADNTAVKTADKKPGDDGKKDAANEAAWRGKFAGARKTLAADSKELDILQREFNLKQQQYYTDPTAAMKQQNSREDLNKTQSEIEAKKQAVEKDKQALSDLEDELRKAGGSPRWAEESSGGASESSDSGSGSSGGTSAGSGGGASGGTSNSTSANSGTSEP
jgi:hypothetical protein